MRQRGFALLIILPVLLGMAMFLSTAAPTDSTKVTDLGVLSDARQRLIAYSAAYIESYKPGSAGPGHLPCPDTDISPDRYAVQGGLHGDGPNPPCGAHTIAVGRLPRHISNAPHRYAFHLEDKHAIWYAVDTRFINNPVNRIVNPETVGRIRWGGQAQVAAVLFIPDEASALWLKNINARDRWVRDALSGGRAMEDFRRALHQSVVITPAALLSAVSQRVALWLQDQLQRGLSVCSAGRECVRSRLEDCNIDVETKLMLLIVQNANQLRCDGSSADESITAKYREDSYLEGVHLWRHWFERNDWWRYIETHVQEECVDIARCVIQVRPRAGSPFLLITLSRVS